MTPLIYLSFMTYTVSKFHFFVVFPSQFCFPCLFFCSGDFFVFFLLFFHSKKQNIIITTVKFSTFYKLEAEVRKNMYVFFGKLKHKHFSNYVSDTTDTIPKNIISGVCVSVLCPVSMFVFILHR